ncbi:uncharacterized protein [Ptychodera flava]|uniref:uncharacterized protein n=1 Tax=Ptychodera flava TaxID=63121 RepID=UPI00396A3440
MIKARYSTCNLPCEYKRNFESSSKEQLLRCSRHKNKLPWQQWAWATKVNLSSSVKRHSVGRLRRFLSMGDVFQKLSTESMYDEPLKDLGGWPCCDAIHIDLYFNTMENNIEVPIKRPQTSASSRQCFEDQLPIKQRSTSSQERRIYSGGKEEWQEPAPLTPISYDFKHFKHSQLYADQYREQYTYAKMKVKKGKIDSITAQATSLPKARLVCLDSLQGVRAMTLLGKSALPAGKIHEHSKSDFEGKWKRYRDTAQVCPIPEIRFIKIPLARRSTPSIPSNANGRFAPRLSSEDEIPCTLDISVATNTVVNPVAGKYRTIALLSQ